MLTRTDFLVESVFVLLKRNVLFVFLLPVWLLKGRAHLKHEIAARVDIDVGLPESLVTSCVGKWKNQSCQVVR